MVSGRGQAENDLRPPPTAETEWECSSIALSLGLGAELFSQRPKLPTQAANSLPG